MKTIIEIWRQVTCRGHPAMTFQGDQLYVNEEQATALAWEAVRICGGPRSIYRNPRQAFSAYSRRMVDVDGTTVEIRYGEISTPAVATVQGWVFEILDEDIELLIRPPKPRPTSPQ